MEQLCSVKRRSGKVTLGREVGIVWAERSVSIERSVEEEIWLRGTFGKGTFGKGTFGNGTFGKGGSLVKKNVR